MGLRRYFEITIRGVTYQDVNAAAQAFGVGADAIRQAARVGRLDRVGMPRGAVPMPICIRGVEYADAHMAARAFGVTSGAIYQALALNRLDQFGLPRRGGARAKAFEIFGMRWPSMSAASVALGFGETYISVALRRQSEAMLTRIRDAAMREGMRRNARAFAARQKGAEAFYVKDNRRSVTPSTGVVGQAGQLARREGSCRAPLASMRDAGRGD